MSVTRAPILPSGAILAAVRKRLQTTSGDETRRGGTEKEEKTGTRRSETIKERRKEWRGRWWGRKVVVGEWVRRQKKEELQKEKETQAGEEWR